LNHDLGIKKSIISINLPFDVIQALVIVKEFQMLKAYGMTEFKSTLNILPYFAVKEPAFHKSKV
jgi:hypothetical protein